MPADMTEVTEQVTRGMSEEVTEEVTMCMTVVT